MKRQLGLRQGRNSYSAAGVQVEPVSNCSARLAADGTCVKHAKDAVRRILCDTNFSRACMVLSLAPLLLSS